ncbi:unnamed protein product [Paramecium primaurelia]|uniref:RNA helicase n=1 Tax=Paramecium primaurelia TaxID=5886 RepID=A0A8S1PRV2_PARPR|nr:unnamed protein product [Paramecium primaurelia]
MKYNKLNQQSKPKKNKIEIARIQCLVILIQLKLKMQKKRKKILKHYNQLIILKSNMKNLNKIFIKNMKKQQIQMQLKQKRQKENIKFILKAIISQISFEHLQLDQKLVNKQVAQNFEKPTAIQSQALLCVLSGRNTGLGKTIAYVWPMLVNVSAQRVVEKKEGPIGLVIVPTRELGYQVFIETKKYTQLLYISVSALLGGENKHQVLIEMIKMKATNMYRCTYVVFDEADQMFSLGLEYQIRSIINQIRPNQQILLFTATMKKKIRQLCVVMLIDPIVIKIGENGNQVNKDIKQMPVIIELKNLFLKWKIIDFRNQTTIRSLGTYSDIYKHRIGRTGRAGNCDGAAYSLVQKQDWKLAIMLIISIEFAGQIVSQK